MVSPLSAHRYGPRIGPGGPWLGGGRHHRPAYSVTLGRSRHPAHIPRARRREPFSALPIGRFLPAATPGGPRPMHSTATGIACRRTGRGCNGVSRAAKFRALVSGSPADRGRQIGSCGRGAREGLYLDHGLTGLQPQTVCPGRRLSPEVWRPNFLHHSGNGTRTQYLVLRRRFAPCQPAISCVWSGLVYIQGAVGGVDGTRK